MSEAQALIENRGVPAIGNHCRSFVLLRRREVREIGMPLGCEAGNVRAPLVRHLEL
jgi:hypothetical protein